MQKRLEPGELLNKKGWLNEAGYAREPVKTYDPKRVKHSRLKRKEWDYYYIQNDECGIAFTVADNGYMGLLSVSVMNFIEKSVHTKSKTLLMPLGRLGLPASSVKGDVSVKKTGFEVTFKNNQKSRVIDVYIDKFQGDKTFNASIALFDEPKDSMVIATPFEEDKAMFYYNRKVLGFKASGQAAIGNDKMDFTEDSSFGLLDWGRGVWPHTVTWYWAAFYEKRQDKEIALNLGYGFGDLSNATENMLFINGKAHKLGDIVFEIQRDEKTGERILDEPWNFTSKDGRIRGLFTPELKRIDKVDLKVLKSHQAQVFGTFMGTVVLEDGKPLEIGPMRGFAEVVENKW
ncbi:MAG: DUF2804 domain-containing protein [Bacillota bacterium]